MASSRWAKRSSVALSSTPSATIVHNEALDGHDQVMASNRTFEDRGKLIGDIPAATAILDRLLESAEVIQITGKNYCLCGRYGKANKSNEN